MSYFNGYFPFPNIVQTGSKDDRIKTNSMFNSTYISSGSGDDLIDLFSLNSYNEVFSGSGDDYSIFSGNNSMFNYSGGSGDDFFNGTNTGTGNQVNFNGGSGYDSAMLFGSPTNYNYHQTFDNGITYDHFNGYGNSYTFSNVENFQFTEPTKNWTDNIPSYDGNWLDSMFSNLNNWLNTMFDNIDKQYKLAQQEKETIQKQVSKEEALSTVQKNFDAISNDEFLTQQELQNAVNNKELGLDIRNACYNMLNNGLYSELDILNDNKMNYNVSFTDIENSLNPQNNTNPAEYTPQIIDNEKAYAKVIDSFNTITPDGSLSYHELDAIRKDPNAEPALRDACHTFIKNEIQYALDFRNAGKTGDVSLREIKDAYKELKNGNNGNNKNNKNGNTPVDITASQAASVIDQYYDIIASKDGNMRDGISLDDLKKYVDFEFADPQAAKACQYFIENEAMFNVLCNANSEKDLDSNSSAKDVKAFINNIKDFSDPGNYKEGTQLDAKTAANILFENKELLDIADSSGKKDNAFSAKTLELVANSPNTPAHVKAAAKFFMNSPAYTNMLANSNSENDHLITTKDLEKFTSKNNTLITANPDPGNTLPKNFKEITTLNFTLFDAADGTKDGKISETGLKAIINDDSGNMPDYIIDAAKHLLNNLDTYAKKSNNGYLDPDNKVITKASLTADNNVVTSMMDINKAASVLQTNFSKLKQSDHRGISLKDLQDYVENYDGNNPELLDACEFLINTPAEFETLMEKEYYDNVITENDLNYFINNKTWTYDGRTFNTYEDYINAKRQDSDYGP